MSLLPMSATTLWVGLSDSCPGRRDPLYDASLESHPRYLHDACVGGRFESPHSLDLFHVATPLAELLILPLLSLIVLDYGCRFHVICFAEIVYSALALG